MFRFTRASLSRLFAGVLLGLPGILKLIEPAPFARYIEMAFGQSPSSASTLAQLISAFEIIAGGSISLAALIHVPRHWPEALALLAGIAVALAVFVLPTRLSCGCFGSYVAASEGRRLMVSGALCYLAIDAWAVGERSAPSTMAST